MKALMLIRGQLPENTVSLECQTAEQALKTYITEFHERSRTEPVRGVPGSSESGTRSRLGMAPPCKSYADLITFGAFNPLINQLHDCCSQEDIDGILKSLKVHKDAFTELLSRCRIAAKELATAMTAAKQRFEQEAKSRAIRKGKANSEAANHTLSGMQLFEFAPTLGIAIDVIPL